VGSGYQVDLGAMAGLVNTLKDAAQSITNANTALKNASTEQLGNDDLNSAGSDFKDRWDYGTGKISDLTGKMTDGLNGTVQAYQALETQLAQSFQSQQSQGSGGSGGSGGDSGASHASGGDTAMAGAGAPAPGGLGSLPPPPSGASSSRISQALNGGAS
jgi:hypothetical protein